MHCHQPPETKVKAASCTLRRLDEISLLASKCSAGDISLLASVCSAGREMGRIFYLFVSFFKQFPGPEGIAEGSESRGI